jgi:hypothetical protein
VSYRDDVDTLYTRAMILQRELDAAQDKLAKREAELAALQGQPRKRADTSPGIRELRTMPDPTEILDRLDHDAKNRTFRANGEPRLPPLPMPDWSTIVGAPEDSLPVPGSMIVRVREGVAKLATEDLALVAKIVEELTDGNGKDDMLRSRLRWLASELALQQP